MPEGIAFMWEGFEAKKKALFRLCNGKKICLWGYGYSGRFCEHLFRRAHKEIEYIIDDSASIDHKLNVERSFILKELDKDTHVVLLAFAREKRVIEFLTKLGYEENENFVFIREWFYGDEVKNRKLSYYDWLEHLYDIDVTAYRMWDELKTPNAESIYYSPGIDYSIVDILDNFEFDDKDAIFDFGCGKGGTLLLFRSHGIGKAGGVEYDEDLYRIALLNMSKMGEDFSGIINNDAVKVTVELDSYNFFFMYNPFYGRTFERVVANLEESYQRRKRKMYVIYSGPYCHEILVRNGIFKFSKVIQTDYAVKKVRVYCTNTSR